MPGRSTYTTADTPRRRGGFGVTTAAGPDPLIAPHIPWAATLVQPQGWVDAASRQPIVVRVTAPIRIASHTPQVSVRLRGNGAEKHAQAAWSAEASEHEASAVTALGTGPLTLTRGRWQVHVHVAGTVLRAGTIAIR